MSHIDRRELRAALARAEWRQSAAAEAVGISPSKLSRAVNNELDATQTSEIRQKLEKMLGLRDGALAPGIAARKHPAFRRPKLGRKN